LVPSGKLDVVGGGIRLGQYGSTAYSNPQLHRIELLAPVQNLSNAMMAGGQIYASNPTASTPRAMLHLEAGVEPAGGSGYYTNQLVLKGDGNIGIHTTDTFYNKTPANIYNTGLDIRGWLRIQSVDDKTLYREMAIDNSNGNMYFVSLSNVATLTAAGQWQSASDIAYKTDIDTLEYGLDAVLKMQPRRYKFKINNSEAIGFIAQEVEQVVPEVVSGKDGAKTLNYNALVAVLTKAIQQQQQEIDELREKVNLLQKQ
jgi:hypothetical protein